VLVGVLVPVANLPLALSVVGELEHAVLRRPRDARPKPSRLVLAWWGAWLVNWILLAVTIVWRLRPGVQAMADSVVLVALTDLAAAGLAIITWLLVRRFSDLLMPIAPDRLRNLRVLKIDGAPEPELHTTRPVGAAR
jgi:CHASE2 domain-containing sensor protein